MKRYLKVVEDKTNKIFKIDRESIEYVAQEDHLFILKMKTAYVLKITRNEENTKAIINFFDN